MVKIKLICANNIKKQKKIFIKLTLSGHQFRQQN